MDVKKLYRKYSEQENGENVLKPCELVYSKVYNIKYSKFKRKSIIVPKKFNMKFIEGTVEPRQN